MAAVGEQTGRADASATRTWGEVKRGYTPMRDGDVVFAKITPCMENGKVALLHGLVGGIGAGSTELVVIRPSASIEPRYLLRFLLQEQVRRDARAVMQGAAGQLRVPLSFLERLTIPLPPLAEQRRIVAALEEHLSELDAAVAGLERARANAGRMVASLIVNELESIRGHEVPLESVLESLRNGISIKPEGENGTRILRISAVRPMRVNLGDVRFLPETGDGYENYRLVEGDLLFTRYNGNPEFVGVCGVVPPLGSVTVYPGECPIVCV